MIGKRWLICSYLFIFLHFAIFANVFFEYTIAIENNSIIISSDNNNIIGHDVTQLNCDDGLTSPVRLTHNRLLFTVPLDLPGQLITNYIHFCSDDTENHDGELFRQKYK